MPASDYRKIAAELLAKAFNAPPGTATAGLERLAQAYLRLADQAEQNRRADIWAEFGAKPALDSEA